MPGLLLLQSGLLLLVGHRHRRSKTDKGLKPLHLCYWHRWSSNEYYPKTNMIHATLPEACLIGGILVLFLTCAVNIRLAKRSRLPLVFSPVDAVNPLWILIQPLLLPLIRRLPSFLRSWTRYNQRGWLFRDKYKMHGELGGAWMHVTPFNKTVYIADAAACQQVYMRKDDFIKPTHIFRRSLEVL